MHSVGGGGPDFATEVPFHRNGRKMAYARRARREDARQVVKIASVAASISWTRRGEAFRRKSARHVAKPRVEPMHIRAVQQRSRITDHAMQAAGSLRPSPGRTKSRSPCAMRLPMTDCHAPALNRSRQPGPTTSCGARGAAGNWLAGDAYGDRPSGREDSPCRKKPAKRIRSASRIGSSTGNWKTRFQPAIRRTSLAFLMRGASRRNSQARRRALEHHVQAGEESVTPAPYSAASRTAPSSGSPSASRSDR
jgi:hypothetical protein